MTTHIKSTPEELIEHLRNMWNKPLYSCGGVGQYCPFALQKHVDGELRPRQNCILPRCEPNRQVTIPRKIHKSSFRGKRVKKLYPNLGIYHATFRRKKTKAVKPKKETVNV